ncbi:ATP synthase beta subunit C-terminal domain-containing protein [Nonomuraea fuscirosea]|uniref:ATP synthase beta subunit C-terminal domain-containing protein n=1 Tax=Nonomuraea fuscirosea TaxID=1291556 RepID=UPI0033FEE004
MLPVLTMPAGDITHPVPDLTGYITEGQIVLSADIPVHPPIDPLASLSRLMRGGVGAGCTRPEHMDLAAQTLAALARARQAGELAELVGAGALSATDRRYLDLTRAFTDDLLSQPGDEARTLGQTFERAWRVLSILPRRELSMLDADALDAHHEEAG